MCLNSKMECQVGSFGSKIGLVLKKDIAFNFFYKHIFIIVLKTN